jgi:hypothetical protein
VALSAEKVVVGLGIELGLILKNPLIVHGLSTKFRRYGKEVIKMERKVKTLMISTVVVLAIFFVVAAMVYANIGVNGADTLAAYTNGMISDENNLANTTNPCGEFFGGMGGPPGKHGHGGGFGEFVTVSQEFKDNVINITESDSDVQTLMVEGYNITEVRPLINATVEADGTVSLKATNAIVTLFQGTTGRATVWVDLEQAKVTRIEILSIKVIDKS